MKHIQLASLTLTTAIATSLAAVSLTAPAASASSPEFNPGTLDPSIGDGSTVALETSSAVPILCLSSTSTGEITGVKTVGSVVITFHNCSVKEGEGCSLKSPGQKAGLIQTSTLDGELGSVKKTEAASGAGLLILPAAGTTITSLEGPCIIASPEPVVGTLAAEVTPVGGPSSKDGKLILEGRNGAQKITEINILGILEKPELRGGVTRTSVSGVGLALFTNAVEVT
jgi:hypothetical protein